MSRPLHIIIVSYVDDNFGDNLIRISFQGLLEVALANHGLAPDDYAITPMSLKQFDERLLESGDAVFFAGGGLFGLSYLGFFEPMDRITAIADRCGIPVVFSSMGLNNMGAEGGNVDAMAQIINRRCVKAIAVRENLPLFQKLVTGLPFETRQIADPAVWTKYVYGMTDVTPDDTLGVNVVRGGLFAANQRRWTLTDEMKYLEGIRTLAESAGIEAQFYTNGSLDDNNTLRFFAETYEVQPDRIVLPQTTREVIEAVASRSAIASIRMHSSIIAYSFGIPTIALEWNDKLPYFYEAIGHPDRVIPFGEWTAERSFETLLSAGKAPQDEPAYQEYLMSTYAYVHEAVGAHVLGKPAGAPAYDFDTVANALVDRSHTIDEDEHDLRHKMGKAERAYLKRFIALRDSKAEVRRLTKQVDELSREATSLSQEASSLSKENDALAREVREQRQELEMRFTARLARRVRRMLRAVFGSAGQ